MIGIEKLPFYDSYMILVEEKRKAEEEKEELKIPEKQLERIKKFYQGIGANYKNNQWVTQTEKNISETNKDEDSYMSRLESDISLGTVLQNAVEEQDDDSIKALQLYRKGTYADLVEQIMFYLGVCRVKSDPTIIEKACSAVRNRYDPKENLSDFKKAGVYYYILYLQCLQTCLERYRNNAEYETVKKVVSERCFNLGLCFKSYENDSNIGNEAKEILSEISNTEALMKEDTEESIV